MTPPRAHPDAVFCGAGVVVAVDGAWVRLDATGVDGASTVQLEPAVAVDLGRELFGAAVLADPSLLRRNDGGLLFCEPCALVYKGPPTLMTSCAIVPEWVRDLLVEAAAFAEGAILSEVSELVGESDRRDALAARLRRAVGP